MSPQSSKSSKSLKSSPQLQLQSHGSKELVDPHGSHLEAVVKRMSDPNFIRLMKGIPPEELVDQLEIIVLSASKKSGK
jgi:hypothetical protein